METYNSIEITKRLVKDGKISQEIAETIFPELKDSEDEKMKEMAIKAVQAPQAQDCIKSWGINPDDVVAWLEKQGNLVQYYEDKLDRCACDYFNKGYKKDLGNKGEQNLANSAKSCKNEQNHAWSEEDEKFFKTALWHISYSVSNGKTTDDHCDTTDWLKSLKVRVMSSHWKPSDEQMEMLRIVTERSLEDTDKKEREIIGTTLGTLCDDLKKLKG